MKEPVRLRAQLLAAAIAIVVAVAAGEVVMRIARDPPGYFPINHREDSLYAAHPVRGYTLKPGAHHRYVTPEVNVPIDVSSDGLRDTTLAEIQRADTRILAVGNSFTMGLAVANEDTWSKQLERLLAARDPRRRVHVVNAGVAGYSPRQIRLRMDELLPIVRPQTVIFELTTQTFGRMFHPNVLFAGTLIRADVLPGIRSVHGGLLYSPYKQAWLRSVDYWLNLHFQLGAHILRRASVILGAMPRDSMNEADSTWIRGAMQPALDELAAAHGFAAARHVPFLVLLANAQLPDGSYSPLEWLYNAIVIERCKKEGIRYIDLLPTLVRSSAGPPIFRTPHDQHWTPAAHALAARALLDSISHRGP
ncbi:MAG TPA: GDSL-type esterase/lipase family protein [Gemmatimonadales bacterium]|nr:GDSL-type esterase/lipase family protein [Gemmatimonadales bacterium]